MADFSKILTDIASAIVDHPEEVEVLETVEEDGTIVLKLKVAQDDMGKVIGRRGRIARAIRLIVKAAAVSADKRVVVDIDD